MHLTAAAGGIVMCCSADTLPITLSGVLFDGTTLAVSGNGVVLSSAFFMGPDSGVAIVVSGATLAVDSVRIQSAKVGVSVYGADSSLRGQMLTIEDVLDDGLGMHIHGVSASVALRDCAINGGAMWGDLEEESDSPDDGMAPPIGACGVRVTGTAECRLEHSKVVGFVTGIIVNDGTLTLLDDFTSALDTGVHIACGTGDMKGGTVAGARENAIVVEEGATLTLAEYAITARGGQGVVVRGQTRFLMCRFIDIAGVCIVEHKEGTVDVDDDTLAVLQADKPAGFKQPGWVKA